MIFFKFRYYCPFFYIQLPLFLFIQLVGILSSRELVKSIIISELKEDHDANDALFSLEYHETHEAHEIEKIERKMVSFIDNVTMRVFTFSNRGLDSSRIILTPKFWRWGKQPTIGLPVRAAIARLTLQLSPLTATKFSQPLPYLARIPEVSIWLSAERSAERSKGASRAKKGQTKPGDKGAKDIHAAAIIPAIKHDQKKSGSSSPNTPKIFYT
jgi:hypothetical protein